MGTTATNSNSTWTNSKDSPKMSHKNESSNSGSTDPTQTGSTTNDPTSTQDSSQKGDYLDQGVGMAGDRFGKNLSREEQEKYSDGIRTGYTKVSGGKEVPIKDQNV